MGVNTKLIIGIVSIIILFIVSFNIVGNTSGDVVDASESITHANNCSDAGSTHTYELASNNCIIGGNSSLNYTATTYSLPLSNLFASNGVLLIIFMVILFIGLMVVVFKWKN